MRAGAVCALLAGFAVLLATATGGGDRIASPGAGGWTAYAPLPGFAPTPATQIQCPAVVSRGAVTLVPASRAGRNRTSYTYTWTRNGSTTTVTVRRGSGRQVVCGVDTVTTSP